MGYYEQLRDEIAADPESVGYLTAGIRKPAAEIVRLLTTPGDALSPAKPWTLPRPSVAILYCLRWGAQTGALTRIKAAADNPASPVQAIAQAAMILIANTAGPPLLIADPGIQAMIGAMVAAGVVTADEQTALLNPTCTRAEMLFGVDAAVTVDDVERAQ